MRKVVLSLVCLLAFASVVSADGATLYKKCAGCHGAKGEKPALGKSKVINKFSKNDIVTALHGYKDGSYGGASKGMMKGQVAKLSENDIVEIAEFIGQ